MLRRLSLYGFKTFAKKTDIDFGEGITCIVGPNGSGKSNISDALRWVLGEQGIKTLRGDKLTEVIFVGSDYSKPLNLAEVVLLLENKSEFFPLKFSEIEVARRVYRDNKSEFSINRTPCRLKDIHEIFLDTGLGKGGISMIGQGQVEKIISSEPSSRRALFEETAGINKYQYRKNTALKKIKTTEDNLLRLADIIHEVEGRLGPLKKEVNKLKRFKRYKERIQELEKELLLQEYFTLFKREEEAIKYSEMIGDEVNNIKLRLSDLEYKRREILKSSKEFYKNYDLCKETHNDLRAHLEKVRTRCSSYSIRKKELEDRLSTMFQMNKSLKDQIEDLKAAIENDDLRSEELNNKLLTLSEDIDSKEKSYSREARHIEILKKAYSRCKEDLLNCTQKVVFTSKELQQLSSTYEELQRDNYNIEQSIKESKNIFSGFFKNKERVSRNLKEVTFTRDSLNREIAHTKEEKIKLEDSMEEIKKEFAVLYKKWSTIEVRLNFLKDLEKSFEGYFPGVKAVMRAKRKKGELSGLIGVVGSLIKVPEKYEKALEIALGGHIQDIVTKTDKDARLAIEYLRKTRKGRATFLPLNLIKGTSNNRSLERWHSLSAVLGQASQLIDYEVKYNNIISYLLSHYYIVTDLKNGLEILKAYNISSTLVTLEGDIIRSSGAITGGSINNKKSNLLSRAREIGGLKKELKKIEEERERLDFKEDSLKKSFDLIQKRLNEKREDFSRAEKKAMDLLRERDRIVLEEKQMKEKLEQLNFTLKKNVKKRDETYTLLGELQRELECLREKDLKLEAEKQELEGKLSSQENQESSLSKALTDLKIESAKIRETIKNLYDFIKSRKIQVSQLKENFFSSLSEIKDLEKLILNMKKDEEEDLLKLFALEKSYEASLGNFSTLKEKKENEGKRAEKLEEKISSHREELNSKEKIMSESQVIQVKVTTEKDILKSQIPEIIEPEFIEPEKVSRELEVLKTRVSDIGFVNYNSQEEYEEVHKRYGFLLEQKLDMEEAIFSLHKVIEEADRKSRSKFKVTFEKVAEEFSLLYSKLFPGGKGLLKLTGEEDYLKSGIEIFVNPPGKKPQTISLLSGGEKCMAALVLLFSIFKVKPAPFCVFDEVDAALDDANTIIFADCLREFSKKSQFLVISHNKITMEKADFLYGVTMEEPGVSHIISLKLDDPVLEKLIAREALV